MMLQANLLAWHGAHRIGAYYGHLWTSATDPLKPLPWSEVEQRCIECSDWGGNNGPGVDEAGALYDSTATRGTSWRVAQDGTIDLFIERPKPHCVAQGLPGVVVLHAILRAPTTEEWAMSCLSDQMPSYTLAHIERAGRYAERHAERLENLLEHLGVEIPPEIMLGAEAEDGVPEEAWQLDEEIERRFRRRRRAVEQVPAALCVTS